jgi:hypothetical protein
MGVEMPRLSLIVVVLLLAACSRGFSDDDIQRLQQDIKEHYEKEQKDLGFGFKVVDVALVRTNDYALTGYAKVQPAAKGEVAPLQLQLNCTAQMDKQNRSVIWQCQPSGALTPMPTTKN